MNSSEINSLDWDEQEIQQVVTDFVRSFHRFPSYDDLVRVRRTRVWLPFRVPLAPARPAGGQ